MEKKLGLGPILAYLASNQVTKIFLQKSGFLDIHLSYHHEQYQKKLNMQSWENLVMNVQTDGREWFHRVLPN